MLHIALTSAATNRTNEDRDSYTARGFRQDECHNCDMKSRDARKGVGEKQGGRDEILRNQVSLLGRRCHITCMSGRGHIRTDVVQQCNSAFVVFRR